MTGVVRTVRIRLNHGGSRPACVASVHSGIRATAWRMGATWWVVPFRRSRPRDLPVVTGRSFETMWEAEFTRSGALLDLYTVDGCDTATTGEARIVVTDPVSGSARVADSWRSGPGLGRHHRGPFPLPEAARIHLAVQYRRVSGTGNVYVVVADGVQCHS